MTETRLGLAVQVPVQAGNAGLFVSRGQGRHPDRVIQTFELIFVREGVLHLEEEGRVFSVQAGETLLLWPGRRHRGASPYGPAVSFFWVHFTVRVSAADVTLSVPQQAAVARPDHLTLLFRRLLDDQETFGQERASRERAGRERTGREATGVQQLSASLTVLLMLQEVGGWPGEGERPDAGSGAALLAGRADALIRTRFDEPLSASGLAAELHCHPDYLGRVFRQTYHTTLTEAIHRRRLQQARTLLLESTEPVDVVARRCGFTEVGYFRRLFRRQEGLSPRAFRQLYARMHVNTD